jgi:hypothetical protein
MGKMYTQIGYAETVETKPGVFKEVVEEHNYTVEVIRLSKRYENSNYVNDNINVNNEFSVLADPYALNHFHNMRYIKLWGQPWEISSVTVEYPRLKLTVGGVYNGLLGES